MPLYFIKCIDEIVYIFQSFENYNHRKMGQVQSCALQNPYLGSLIFVQTVYDTPFGQLDVYRMKQPPYQYIAGHRKNYINDSANGQKFMQMMNKLKQLQHKNLSKIYHSQEVQQVQLCIKTKRIYTFHGYYNFTLEQAINKRRLKLQTFCQNQLIYVFGCLLDLALYFKKYNISLGEYRCQSIFLSPQGHVKLYLTDFQAEQQHSCFRKALEDKALIHEFILAPEQLFQIKQMNDQIKYDVYKADLFAMAMVILELITLQKTKYYYTEDLMALRSDRIAFTISNYSCYFSEPFIKLLKSCLQPNPFHRISLEDAYQQLKLLKKGSKNVAYCIKLQEEDISKRESLRKSFSIPLKSQFIVNSLQKKLTATLKHKPTAQLFDKQNTQKHKIQQT